MQSVRPMMLEIASSGKYSAGYDHLGAWWLLREVGRDPFNGKLSEVEIVDADSRRPPDCMKYSGQWFGFDDYLAPR